MLSYTSKPATKERFQPVNHIKDPILLNTGVTKRNCSVQIILRKIKIKKDDLCSKCGEGEGRGVENSEKPTVPMTQVVEQAFLESGTILF